MPGGALRELAAGNKTRFQPQKGKIMWVVQQETKQFPTLQKEGSLPTWIISHPWGEANGKTLFGSRGREGPRRLSSPCLESVQGWYATTSAESWEYLGDPGQQPGGLQAPAAKDKAYWEGNEKFSGVG